MINDINDLKKLFKLCRAQGVIDFKMNGLEIKFGDLPHDEPEFNGQETDYEELSDEDLMFYSSPKGQEELDKKVGIR